MPAPDQVQTLKITGRAGWFCAVATAAILFPMASHAQDGSTPLSEVTVSATRIATPISQVASSVSVITAQQIEDEQLRTLPDLLKQVPGLNVMQTGGPGGPAAVYIRGSNANHVKVLVDGIDVADNASTSDTFDFAHLLTGDIERVEVLRGPQSGLYGSDAIGGVINVITKSGSGPFQATASFEGGTYDTTNLNAGIRGQLGRLHYALDAAQYQATTPVTPLELLKPGAQRIDDYYNNKTLSTKLGYDVTPALDLGFVGRWTQTELRDTGDDFSTFPAFPATEQSASLTQQYYTRGTAHLSALDGKLDNTVGVAYSSDRRTEFSPPGPADYYLADRLKYDYQGAYKLMAGETVTFGAEREDDRYRTPVSATNSITSGYGQLQSNIGGVFFNAVSVRYDSNNRFGDKATYRIAPAFLIKQTGTKLKATYGTGFKAPSLDQLFHSYPSFGFFANPNLKPETSEGYDLGFDQSLLGGRVTFGATYFRNNIKDLINSTFTSLVNVGRAVTEGVESYAAYNPTKTISLRADYTYTEARDDQTKLTLLRRPKSKASVQGDWHVTPAVLLTGTVVYVGPYIDGNRDFSVSRLTAPAVTTGDITASWDATKDATLYLRATNVSDVRYQSPTGFLAPGRMIVAGFRLHY